MDVDEYVCPRPPTICRRKKSVSRISGGSCPNHDEETPRRSSSLFSLPSDEEFDMEITSENCLFFGSNSSMMELSARSSRRLPLREDDHDHALDFDRISPISVMDTIYDPFRPIAKDQKHATASGLPPVPDLVSSFSSDGSSSILTTPGTPSPKRPAHRQKIQKWSSFHEDGRDWGTSEACDPIVTKQLLHLLTMMEGEEERER
mmetsp:Transcript_45193/g.109372  ORF Transcript_45193/g.109372 Transcript_45193/m.109372 type:complete len:204 (-) Transcript_45193:355-966(-)|eukprot:CAMPEP_0113629474 /NCGR_PEP_ID=MMETSP0017_2-20120614/15300_1 /TAXON_ID=2856 /ORGANISM="Cylindrotheca closterium" /LENGTH=203 /DNA_ID=CAMNT_0000539873 /DNA_START=207 /DNA_END=818 /DNA_ORIENTATION=+ /assembly_acc=CAM_ASM_000147